MKQIRQHWFLVTLIVALFAGYRFAEVLEPLAALGWLKWTIVSFTMFVMAWPLEFGSLKRTITRPLPPAVACLLNVGLIPLLVWPFAIWMGPELGPGMIVAAATPCTLASAAVWTRRAGGNDSVAILVTIVTNATCFLVMPAWIFVQTGNSIDNEVLFATIYKLFLFVVLPISLAQLVRTHRLTADWATRNKPTLSLLAMVGVLAMVFLGSANMGLKSEGQSLAHPSMLLAAVVLTAVHCLVFWLGIGVAGWLSISRGDQIAIGFAGSQKTLMIGLGVAINLGVSIIPIIVYHAIQLIVDTVFADWLNKRPTEKASS